MSCIIFFNCHGEEIKRYLSNSVIFANKYKLIHIPLYDYLAGYKFQNEKNLVQEHIDMISNADILILQNMRKDRSFLNFDEIKKYAKESCKIIKIPHYTFSGYFSRYEAKHDLNLNIEKSYNELIKYIDNLECHTDEFIKSNLELELVHIKELDCMSDIKMYDFIENNYNKTRLFYSRIYPTGTFFYYLSKEILRLIEIYDLYDIQSMLFVNHEIPIHQKIINVLHLNFPYKSNRLYNYNIIEYYVACKRLDIDSLILDYRGKHKQHVNMLNEIINNKQYK